MQLGSPKFSFILPIIAPGPFSPSTTFEPQIAETATANFVDVSAPSHLSLLLWLSLTR